MHCPAGHFYVCGENVTQPEYAAAQPWRAYYPVKRGVPSFAGKGTTQTASVSFPPELAPATENVVGVFLSSPTATRESVSNLAVKRCSYG